MSTLVPAVRGPLPWGRVLAVVRALYGRWGMTIAFPLGIMASSFIINVIIFAALVGAVENPTTGGLASLYITFGIVCWSGLSQNFSFVVGLNATRRSFYAATVIVAMGQSLLYGVLLYLLGIVERATGGWGVNLLFYNPARFPDVASPATILLYAVPLAFLAAMGVFFGTVGKRWGGVGVFFATVLLIVVVGGLIAVISFAHAWPVVGSWLAGQPLLALLAGWPLIPIALMLASGWLVLRRATP